jgi:response regulator RpfG family c-di-GMP phosphodiesterase
MNQLAAICDSPENARRVHWQLKGLFDIQCLSPDELGAAQPPGRYTIVAVNLDDLERVRGIRHWLTQKPKDAKVIFVTDQGSRLDRVRARAVGATDFVQPPVNASALLTKLYGDFQCVRGKPKFCDEASPGIVVALESVQAAFALAWLGAPFDQTAMNGAAEAITGQVEEQGLASWIETVRRHRSHTYRHSLLVTGLAVGFGLQLGFSRTDSMRLSFAGIMHDIGKAKIPASILEKPGALDAGEMDVIKQHPMFGWQALRNVSGIPAEIMNAVLHHHEFLDGTGYPHGLAGRAISDFVRLLTIVDIFAALIEGLCYKSASSCDAAYQVLLDMGARLDSRLVEEFRAVLPSLAGLR